MAQPGLPGSQFAGDDASLRRVRELEQRVQQVSAANILATAGIGVIPDGVIVNGQMQFKREDGTLGVSVDPTTGTFVAYNAAGTAPVARFGTLLETAPTEYGVEVLVDSTWVRLGNQTTTWATISGKPGDVGGATIPGTFITGTVPDATTSDTTAHADGVTPAAYSRNVAGIPGSYVAMWMHDSGVIGYNTSDEKYKRNIRDYTITEEQLLGLRPVLYDRKATDADDYTPPVSVDELGLIAAETHAFIPELGIKRNGELDGVFYERLGVALLPFVQRNIETIRSQQTQIDNLTAAVRALGGDI